VRTTLTLDEDVAAKLRLRARQTGRAFRDVVNDALRRGLASVPRTGERPPFVVSTRDLGALRPGLNLDDVSGLVEQLEGPLHR
jgi:plasmid stability protein